MFDLDPAAQEMSRLVSAVRDDQLDQATPCTGWTVRDLLVHIHQFATVFTANATKVPVRPPDELVPGWRDVIADRLEALALAWREESAWQGRVTAGGMEMAAPDNALVAAEELTVHGWDLAVATGQDVVVDEARLDLVDRFLEVFAGPIGSGRGPFGPTATAPEQASRLQRILARTGRDPLWAATA